MYVSDGLASLLLANFDSLLTLLKRQSRLQQTTSITTFSLFFRENKDLISCQSSARQRIHMKHQALFSSKDNSKQEGNGGPGSLT